MTKLASFSLTQRVYEGLKADLVSCRLKPGERLKIRELAQRRDCNVSAVREALSRLTADGLVYAEPQRGFHARPISPTDLRDLTMARLHIETLCLQMSIEKGDVAWESRLVSAFHSLSRTAETMPDDREHLNERWIVAHRAYHDALVSACDSPWLTILRGTLYEQTERYRQLSYPLSFSSRDIGLEHRNLLDATIARDAPRALELLREHLERTTVILLESQQTPISPLASVGE